MPNCTLSSCSLRISRSDLLSGFPPTIMKCSRFKCSGMVSRKTLSASKIVSTAFRGSMRPTKSKTWLCGSIPKPLRASATEYASLNCDVSTPGGITDDLTPLRAIQPAELRLLGRSSGNHAIRPLQNLQLRSICGDRADSIRFPECVSSCGPAYERCVRIVCPRLFQFRRHPTAQPVVTEHDVIVQTV